MNIRIRIAAVLAAAWFSPGTAYAFPRVAHEEPARGAVPEPTGDLTLQDALAAAQARSPELAAYPWAVRAADAQVIQSGLLPNPEFGVEAENIGGSGAFRGEFENTLQLSQLIELGGKRDRRVEAALLAKDRAAVEYESKRAEVLFETALDFIDAVSEQEVEKLAKVGITQARGLIDGAKRRTTAGVGSPLEVKRAQILTARAEIAELRAAHRLRAARHKLASRWGGAAPSFGELKGDLFASEPVPSLDALFARLEAAPERALALAEEKVRTAEVALARTKRTPDLSISLGFRHGESLDDRAAVAGFSVPLQLFDRAQGEIGGAEAMVGKARAETTAVEVRLRAALASLHQELLRASGEMDVMRKEIIPRAEESLVLARDGFAQGLFSQLDLLDAQRTLVEVRLEYIEAATGYHRLVAEVERLLGGPL